MAGSSQSTSQQQSTSNSSSYIPDYPQTSLLQAIAQYANQLGDATYNWGQQQYAKTSGITDQNINNYLTTSAQALQNANSDEARYKAIFQPEENQLINDANSYNSTARQQYEMGKAESRAGAGLDRARQNHERQLLSYGIDPSSGRYDALDRADELAKAAAQVGAGQQAYDQTSAVGRQLRADAIQVGARYPGQITNEQNTGLQGIAGAENSNLANANTGIALNNAANPYLQTASSLKYSPLGTNSTSQSTGTSQSSSVSSDPASSGGSKSPQQQQPQQQQGSGGSGSPSSGGGSGSGSSVQSNGVSGDGSDYVTNGDGQFTGDLGDISYDNTSDGTNWDGGITTSDISVPDYYSGGGDYNAGGDSGGFDPGAMDYGGGDSGGGEYFAGGGAIPEDSGPVPASMSPSGGSRVDDVRAQGPGGARINLNADEFVIPRDVVQWKGQEYFQKLIAGARKNNAMAAAKPRVNYGGQHAAR